MSLDSEEDAKQIWVIVQRLERQGEILDKLVRVVMGDGDGNPGLKIRVHDLEGSTDRLLNWAKYVGVMVTANVLAVLGYLLKWWADLSVGGSG